MYFILSYYVKSVAILAQDPIHVLGLGSYLSPIGLNWCVVLIVCIGDWICLCIDFWILGDFGPNPPCSVGYTEFLSFVLGLHDICGTAEAATLFILAPLLAFVGRVAQHLRRCY